jgi:tetratricopeptide (TPR) repeat protein
MALNAKKDEEKIKYFQNTIEQDYRNENGIKVQALNNLGIVYSEQKNYHSAYLFLQYALKIDPKNEDVKANFVYLQELAIKQNEDYFRSEEKFNRLIGNMRAVGGALQAVGSSMPSSSKVSSSSSVSSSSGSGSVGYKTLQNKSNSSMLSHPDILARTRSYDGWVTQLINMNTYYETQYNDSNRRYIQEQMRHVREELLAKRGYSYPQSDWETWDGHKR